MDEYTAVDSPHKRLFYLSAIKAEDYDFYALFSAIDCIDEGLNTSPRLDQELQNIGRA